MKAYDVICPICRHINRNLYLEETGGWIECERCKETVQVLPYSRSLRIPELFFDPLPQNVHAAQQT